ncbi:hypothetical protein ACXIUS_04455 [Bosea thiooxidans]
MDFVFCIAHGYIFAGHEELFAEAEPGLIIGIVARLVVEEPLTAGLARDPAQPLFAVIAETAYTGMVAMLAAGLGIDPAVQG